MDYQVGTKSNVKCPHQTETHRGISTHKGGDVKMGIEIDVAKDKDC